MTLIDSGTLVETKMGTGHGLPTPAAKRFSSTTEGRMDSLKSEIRKLETRNKPERSRQEGGPKSEFLMAQKCSGRNGLRVAGCGFQVIGGRAGFPRMLRQK